MREARGHTAWEHVQHLQTALLHETLVPKGRGTRETLSRAQQRSMECKGACKACQRDGEAPLDAGNTMQERQGDREPELEACVVRFASVRSDVTARVCWVTDGKEVEYAKLWPG